MESASHLEEMENTLNLYDIVKMEQSEAEDEEDSFNNKPQQCDFTRCSLQSESVHFSRIDRIPHFGI